ncbi:ANTAR domain-containing protein [Nocardioides sp. JQ2195]|uniref:ANTAR domain-containing protein n=1 Tax=Nocardioides sp. JQ2195 TaxID=2592334 RepID=UPI00143E709B|nr:ANTAR domain-containing protein [Nocardioides sp. JQ2195]QIX25547.1 ANTAR domain-containing protein [Nocardioides sp. JQ2195]
MSDDLSHERHTRLEEWQTAIRDDSEVAGTDRERAEIVALQADVADLHRALESQPVIDQAKGILMARFRLDAEAAFAVLTRLSQDRNIKVREISLAMVEIVSGTSPTDVEPSEAEAVAREVLGPVSEDSGPISSIIE